MGGDKVGSEVARGRPISGYGGFVPSITAGNIFAHDYQKSLSAAQQLTATQDEKLGLANPQYTDGTYIRDALKGKEVIDKAGYPEVLKSGDVRIAKVRTPVPSAPLRQAPARWRVFWCCHSRQKLLTCRLAVRLVAVRRLRGGHQLGECLRPDVR